MNVVPKRSVRRSHLLIIVFRLIPWHFSHVPSSRCVLSMVILIRSLRTPPLLKCFNDSFYDEDDFDEFADDMVSDDKKLLSNIISPTTTIASYRNNNDCPWSNSGLLLIELASAFELSYGATFENDQQRQQYELYRRMKSDVLRNQARFFYGNNDQNIFGVNLFELGKAVLSQALLTGMWFMLKRIKIV